MSLADELKKLQELKDIGALTREEFELAKRKILGEEGVAPVEEVRFYPDDSLGTAANRYVSFHIIMSAIGIIVFLLVFFAIFLPRFLSISEMMP